MIHLIYTDLG